MFAAIDEESRIHDSLPARARPVAEPGHDVAPRSSPAPANGKFRPVQFHGPFEPASGGRLIHANEVCMTKGSSVSRRAHRVRLGRARRSDSVVDVRAVKNASCPAMKEVAGRGRIVEM